MKSLWSTRSKSDPKFGSKFCPHTPQAISTFEFNSANEDINMNMEPKRLVVELDMQRMWV